MNTTQTRGLVKRNKEIIEKYEKDNKTIRDLATEYGVKFQRIHQILRTHRVKMRDPGSKEIFDKEKIKELLLQGASSKEIAKTIGCTQSTITKVRIEFGIPNSITQKRLQILQYMKDNPEKTQEEIAKLFGTYQRGVSIIKRRYENGKDKLVMQALQQETNQCNK